MVGSKPLWPVCVPRLNVALAFRAVLADQNSTITLYLVPAPAALNKCSHMNVRLGFDLPNGLSKESIKSEIF